MKSSHAITRILTTDGAELQAFSGGAGRTLLLVSGLGGTAEFWQPVATGLADCRTVAFDQRGLGASTRGTAPCTIDTLADDCLCVLDQLDIRRCIVVGHSTGGCIGMALAARAPARIDGLVLSASWLRPNRYMSALFSARAAILRRAPEAYATVGAMLGYPAQWLEDHWDTFDTMVRRAPCDARAQDIVSERIGALLAFDGAELPARLQMPVLIVGAHDDLIVPFFLQQELSRRLTGTTIAALDTGGHFFPVTQTERFCALLHDWIERM